MQDIIKLEVYSFLRVLTFFIELDRFIPVFGSDTGKGCYSQVFTRAIGGITTCHKMRHSLSLTTFGYICLRELPLFHHGPTSSFQTLSRSKLLQVDQGLYVTLANCSFWVVPPSRNSVDLSPRAFHSSTHNVVRATCFEVFSASVESIKLFLDGRLLLYKDV